MDCRGMRQKEREGQRFELKTREKMRQGMGRIGRRTLWPLSLLFCVILVCAGCSSQHTASRIQLMKTEGQVDIANGRGREVSPVPEIKLYSGYRM